MKTRLLVAIACVVLVLGSCKTKQFAANKTLFDERTKKEVMYGLCDENGLRGALTSSWFVAGYDGYEPDLKVLEAVPAKAYPDLRIVSVFGSWCGDSKRELPHFFKLLNQWGFDVKHHKAYGVDTKKTAPDIDTKLLNIRFVPTFIFYNGSKEIGRIIERPEQSLEVDMIGVLSNY